MDLATWSRLLADRALTIVPPSFLVPVQLWMLTRNGHALRFRCRGTTARLSEFSVESVAVGPAAAICGCGCGAIAAAPVTAGSLTVRPGAAPVREAVYDGAEKGWHQYAAGLLGPEQAAGLLERLLDELGSAPLPASGTHLASAPLLPG